MRCSAVISMQHLRTQLATVADRVGRGESLLVVRNSRLAFRLVPLGGAPQLSPEAQRTWQTLEDSLDKEPAFTEKETMETVQEVRRRAADKHRSGS